MIMMLYAYLLEKLDKLSIPQSNYWYAGAGVEGDGRLLVHKQAGQYTLIVLGVTLTIVAIAVRNDSDSTFFHHAIYQS